MTHDNRSAYVRSRYQFELRDNPVDEPAAGRLLVRVGACGVCGTDLHIADRVAADWQTFGHEAAGTVVAVGEGVTRFAAGDRVALDSSAPCGVCETCLPRPFGRGRGDLCPTPASYWGTSTMGFGQLLLTPHQLAVRVPDGMADDVACLVEPVGVSMDLVQTAAVAPGDHVLVVGPGPLGLGAVAVAKRAGAERVMLAGRSSSKARMAAGEALGADLLIETDKASLAAYDFGRRKPDKVLVTSPPQTLLEAISVAAYGGAVAYIGIAFGPESVIELDVDAMHFRKLSLRASHASPGTHAMEAISVLAAMPELGRELISHRFVLDDIALAMDRAAKDRIAVKKMVMVAG